MNNPLTYFEKPADINPERLNSLVDELGSTSIATVKDGTYTFYTSGSGYVKTIVVKNGLITDITLS